MRALRSLLFVPGNRVRMLEKARTLTADAVILDLEDSVPVAEKPQARAAVREALGGAPFGPLVVVRVNAFSTGLTEVDLRETLVPAVGGVCLSKVDTSQDVTRLSTLLSALEQEREMPVGSVGILLMIETALGVLNAYLMARASQRVQALCVGGEDLCWDLGAVRTKEGLELAYPRAQVVLAARAAGVVAVDTVYTHLGDLAGLLAEARQARQLGYAGKLVIHPAQIEVVNRAFTPGEDEVAYARRVIVAFQAATARGEGAFALDGKMVDAPIVARARVVLAQVGED